MVQTCKILPMHHNFFAEMCLEIIKHDTPNQMFVTNGTLVLDVCKLKAEGSKSLVLLLYPLSTQRT